VIGRTEADFESTKAMPGCGLSINARAGSSAKDDAVNAILADANLLLAWIWILLGFISGAVMGTQFRREDWLGGYGSFRRRMYRLGHISFFGLALMNLMFHFTAQSLHLSGSPSYWASRGFLIGAITMPICCVVMAHFPKTHALFAVPVVSLIAASGLTLWGIIQT
jgi:hypothetical protein